MISRNRTLASGLALAVRPAGTAEVLPHVAPPRLVELGTRTPDPLLANRRQRILRRPFPQVTVLGRAFGSIQIQACC